MNRQKGFTLIELLVVIAIIGILASVVLASLNSARERSRDARRVSDVRQVQLALELAFDSDGAYPSATSTLINDGYLAVWPNDPLAAQSYGYAANANGTSYVVSATLENDGHSALDSDIDGTAIGVNCADPVYCVQP